ncbi:hypothetical protein HOL63_01215 [Candidatus Peregrinibacteria bacterium]|nr:hypothetical protein [Candidatus Peregrinibacteria bacterium]MBT5468475.1 hypothetical protein [Candidatus Peregrinibacteria bacterium]MBT7337291.1 hypothetical protein [Candidatus Peregrinibacteria bacterium]
MANKEPSISTSNRQETEEIKDMREVNPADIRRGFEDFVSINFQETGLLSSSQVRDQRQYMEKLLSNHGAQWGPLIDSYLSESAEQRKAENLQMYHNEVEGPLKNALGDKVISEKSYASWMGWIRDGNRHSDEKKSAINTTLPTYLAERRRVSVQRDTALNDPRFSVLSKSNDSKIKEMCGKLSNKDEFQNSLTFPQRQALITNVLSALPIVDGEQSLFASLSKELDSAVGTYISADSKKKWIARFNDPSINPKAREYFVKRQFPSYVASWKKIHTEYQKLQGNPIAATLEKNDVADIALFQDPKKFLALHYDKKVNIVQEVQNAVVAKAEGKETLHSEIKTVIDAAAQAKYVSYNNTGYLVAHMMERDRSVKEVKNFVKEWSKVRFRFDVLESKMTKGRVPQGLTRLSETSFLSLTFAQRKSYVEETESRVGVEDAPEEHSSFKDIKGKIRHALDSENWDEAEAFLALASPMAITEHQVSELESMKRYLKTFSSSSEEGESGTGIDMKSAIEAKKEIDSCLSQLPAPIRPFYENALSQNAGSVRTIGVLIYNVQWSLDRGYLPRDLGSVRETAREETVETLRPGVGHGNRIENNLVDGHQKPAINEEPNKAQNICTSSSEASLIAQTANNNKDNYNFWYWSNLIVQGVSAGEYENVANNLRGKLTRAAYALESQGLNYASVGPMTSLN